MLNILQKTKRARGRSKLLQALLFTCLAVAGCLNQAMAQRTNQSDWNVPPPLAPGNTTKGDAAGKDAKGKMVLTQTDVPAVAQPGVSAVPLPFLAAVSTIAPTLDAPDQPTISGADAGMPEIPLPGAPDMPGMPQRSLQDAQTPASVDLPLPASPDLPAFPAEPASPGMATGIKLPVPVTPDVMGFPTFSQPLNSPFVPWSTPGIPENAAFKFVVPGTQNGGANGKNGSGVKSKSLKNK